MVELTQSVGETLGLKDGSYTIRCGGRAREAPVRLVDGKVARICIADSLVHRMLLPSDQLVNVWFEPALNTIRLGPVIGVFVNEHFMRQLRRGAVPLGARELIRANTENGLNCLVYFFSVYNVDSVRQRIEGLLYRGGKWEYHWLPFPDVIFDRGVSFREKDKALVRAFRKQIRQSGVLRLNSTDKLAKWKTHLALSKCPRLAPYLPETRLVSGFQDILALLSRYPEIILKADSGSRSQQVMLVAKKGNSYETSSIQGDALVENLDALQQHINNFMGGHRFIAQRVIPLALIEGRLMECRVYIAKDLRGQWVENYNYAWISSYGFARTYAEKAEVLRAGDALRLAGWSIPGSRRLTRQATHVSILAAECLEREFGVLGELGIDLGIDEDGRIWLFEANSKPDRTPVPHLDRMYRPLPYFTRPLEYCMHLSGADLGGLPVWTTVPPPAKPR